MCEEGGAIYRHLAGLSGRHHTDTCRKCCHDNGRFGCGLSHCDNGGSAPCTWSRRHLQDGCKNRKHTLRVTFMTVSPEDLPAQTHRRIYLLRLT